MSSFAAAVSRMQSIDLGRLNAVAALTTRQDRKYVVSESLVEEMFNQCELEVLEIDGLRTFRYESVYFDTPDRISYRDAAHKRRRRFKVRTRTYLDSGICSLEVKTRDHLGRNNKTRLSYPLDRRNQLTRDALEFIGRFDRIAPIRDELQPALTTRYSRTTLFEPVSGSRITVDTGLAWETPTGSRLALPGVVIVETKTTGRPCPVDRFLWERHLRPTKISKYCTGLAALTPGLAANRWNRVLRTYFGWSRAADSISRAGLAAVPEPAPFAEPADRFRPTSVPRRRMAIEGAGR